MLKGYLLEYGEKIKTNDNSLIIHQYFFYKNKFDSQKLLQIIKTNNIDKKNDIYYFIENYIHSSSPNEHEFINFYKNDFTKSNHIIPV